MKAKKLPESLRELLHKPVGELLTERAALERLRARKPKLVVAVGDTVGYMLFKNGLRPDVFVYDYKNLRVPVSEEVRGEIERHVRKAKRVRNEAGTISGEMERALLSALKDRRGNIFVKGEEDLAALVALARAPDETIVIYGQPNEGVVLVEVNAAMRAKALGWLAECEEV
ncbi:MAG: DUF359 domain-containing protein [Candidatus Micrarchaeia archaeon]